MPAYVGNKKRRAKRQVDPEQQRSALPNVDRCPTLGVHFKTGYRGDNFFENPRDTHVTTWRVYPCK